MAVAIQARGDTRRALREWKRRSPSTEYLWPRVILEESLPRLCRRLTLVSERPPFLGLRLPGLSVCHPSLHIGC